MGKGQSAKELKNRRGRPLSPRGRPRLYDPIKIAEELVEWSKHPESMNMAQFCSDRGYLPKLIWRLEKECQDFEDAYTLAKLALAARRENYLNCEKLNYGAWQRYQRSYDPFLAKAEDEKEDKDAKRKSGIVQKEQANLVMLARMAAKGEITQDD